MKKIFITLLVLCFVFSSSVTSYAVYSTGEYEVIFKTKASYKNTEYEEIFSDHRNFLDIEILGISDISGISIYGVSYNTNFNPPSYILRAAIGFGSQRKAAAICAELMSRGIAEWALFMKLGDFGFYDIPLNTCSISEMRFVKLSGDTFGDIDCNNAVDAGDARTALRIAVGLENRNDYPYLIGDMDYDGDITVSDAREILRAATGLSVNAALN